MNLGARAVGAAPSPAADPRAGAWTTPGGGAAWPLVAVVVLAVALRVGLAVGSPNLLWFDEIIETLEQGHRLAFGYGLVPWEFRLGTRSWVWPALLAAVMRPASLLGPGSAPYLAAVALALSALSAVPIVAAYRWAGARGRVAAIVAAVAVASWFELVYLAPKAFSEVAAAHLLVAALAVGSSERAGRGRALAAGALLGLTLVLRVHLAPAVLVAWLATPGLRRGGRPLLLGLAVVLGVAGLVDWLTWGAPFVSFFRSVRVNVIEGKASEFGVLPWWAYLEVLRRVWGWAAPAVVVLGVLGARRRPELLAVALAVLASHAVVPHKEYRFVYPAVLLLVLCAALGLGELARLLAARAVRHGSGVALVLAALWMAISAERARGFDNHRTMQGPPPGSTHWSALGHVLTVFRAASREPTCGVALLRLPWTETGGYAWLHHDVPLYEVADGAELARRAAAYDVAIGWAPAGEELGPFRAGRCVRGICLYRRPPGEGCRPEPALRLERLLEARGE